ncbi:MAG: DNA cytosine methyltransferase, partial [Cyanobacteria bacterium J06638_22]
RMNQEAKTFHPVYNNMSFPDKLDAPSRTVTATCTRVSRESIVVSDKAESNKYRRLTVRERATLQGFPITYQFFGKSFSEKAKMVGNAIPPSFTYIMGLVMRGEKPTRFSGHLEIEKSKPELALPDKYAPKTAPDTVGRTYPAKRRYKAAIPNLRFKSGMRFEFSNHFENDLPIWDVRFYSGNSKQIFTHMLDDEWYAQLSRNPLLSGYFDEIENRFSKLVVEFQKFDPVELQRVWTRRIDGKGPYSWVDGLGECAEWVYQEIVQDIEQEEIERITLEFFGRNAERGRAMNEAKMTIHAARILSGLIVGSWVNKNLCAKKVAMAA